MRQSSDDSSKSIAFAQMSVIEAYNFLFKVNIDLYPYLQKMPTGDSIKCLSRQFAIVSNIFCSLPMVVSPNERLGK